MIIENINGKPLINKNKLWNKEGIYYSIDKNWVDKNTAIDYIKSGIISNARIQGKGIAIIKPKIRIEKINIKNLESLAYFINFKLKTTDRDNYTFQGFIEDYDRSKYNCLEQYPGYIVYNGNQIVEWVGVIDTLGIKILIQIYNIDTHDKEPIGIRYLLNKSNKFLYMTDGCDAWCNKYKSANFKSSIDSDYRYVTHCHNGLVGNYPDCISKAIEAHYFIRDVDIDKIRLRCMTTSEIYTVWSKKYMKGVFEGYWINKFNNPSAVGFHYFSFSDSKNDARFIVAIYKGLIIGVIKLGVYNNDHQAIAYIDVLRTCRNKGVATYMIKNINKYLYKGLPLMITDESDMGKMCHIADKFKDNVKGIKVKTYAEALRDGKYD